MSTESTTKPLSEKPSFWWLKYVILGLLVLALLAYFFMGRTSGLYGDYMNYPPIKSTIRANPGNIFTDANMAYADRNFKAAVASYEKAQPNLLKANLYYGICLMEVGKTAQARKIFSTIATNKSMESPLAQWYQAMSYVKEGANESAILALEAVTDKSPYFKKAAELRTALELNPR